MLNDFTKLTCCMKADTGHEVICADFQSDECGVEDAYASSIIYPSIPTIFPPVSSETPFLNILVPRQMESC